MNAGSSGRIYHVPSVVGVLDEPMPGPNGEGSFSHYSRSYYVIAENEDDAIELVRGEERRLGASLLESDPPVLVGEKSAPAELRKVLRGGRGVKWKSGRAFFSAS